jgi:hypothetical protein
MKKYFFLLMMVFSGLLVNAQPPSGDAKKGDFYGEKVSPDGSVAIADVAAKLKDDEAVNAKFTAKVLEVCSKKGCWLKLAVDDKTTAFVKMKDYAFFVPMAAVGKTVVIDGELKTKTVSVAELRHYAEDAKKSEKEIAAIDKPQQELRVLANGITIID